MKNNHSEKEQIMSKNSIEKLIQAEAKELATLQKREPQYKEKGETRVEVRVTATGDIKEIPFPFKPEENDSFEWAGRMYFYLDGEWDLYSKLKPCPECKSQPTLFISNSDPKRYIYRCCWVSAYPEAINPIIAGQRWDSEILTDDKESRHNNQDIPVEYL